MGLKKCKLYKIFGMKNHYKIRYKKKKYAAMMMEVKIIFKSKALSRSLKLLNS